MGPWARNSDNLAVAFYADGKLQREYKINQLVSDPLSLPHSVSHFEWRENVSFDDAKKHLSVTVLADLKIERVNNRPRMTRIAGETFVFDITTGQMIKGKEVVKFAPKNPTQKCLQNEDFVGLMRLGKDAFPELIDTVRHGSGRKLNMAWGALCAGGENAIEPLTALIDDTNATWRASAVHGLQEISSPKVKPVLIRVLQDKNIWVRARAIAALFQIHEEAVAEEPAARILSSESDEDKRTLFTAISRLHPTCLIAHVIPLTGSVNAYRSGSSAISRQANHWLSVATFQKTEALIKDAPAGKMLSEIWSEWWQDNKNRSRDEWFRQAVERDLILLRDKNVTSCNVAFRHLREITGRYFGFSGEIFKPTAVIDWDAWWQSNKQRRCGELLIEAIAGAKMTLQLLDMHRSLEENQKALEPGLPLSETLRTLELYVDKRDVPALITLYTTLAAEPTMGPYYKAYVEMALRRLTNLDSYGASMIGGIPEQQIIQKWREYAKSAGF